MFQNYKYVHNQNERGFDGTVSENRSQTDSELQF